MSEVPAPPWSLDAHCDSVITRLYANDPLDLRPVERQYHVTPERLRQGNLRALFAMVGDKHLIPSLRMIDGVHRFCAEQPGEFALCLTATDVRRAVAAGRVAIVMTIEGQSMFAENLELLRDWHRLGVRLASLTHGEAVGDTPGALQGTPSHFGYCSESGRSALRHGEKGLTPFARAALAEMGCLGMACDLAHVNDTAFWEALQCATGPVCSTHTACAALTPHSRNLTDEMMKALAQRGGVIGVCFWHRFVDQEKPTLERYVDHVLHALEIMGEDGVGIGTDFDGVPEGDLMVIKDPSMMGDLWEALDRRGVSRRVQEKIAHDNFLRLLPQ